MTRSEMQSVIYLCSWCEVDPEAEARAEAAGETVSYGLCERCRGELLTELRALKRRRLSDVA